MVIVQPCAGNTKANVNALATRTHSLFAQPITNTIKGVKAFSTFRCSALFVCIEQRSLANRNFRKYSIHAILSMHYCMLINIMSSHTFAVNKTSKRYSTFL